MAHDTPSFDNTSFRYGTDGTETGHGWVYGVDTDGELEVDTTYLMRIVVGETAAVAATNMEFQWEYNRNLAGWVSVTASSSVIIAVNSSNLTEGEDTTQRLGSGTFITDNDAVTEDGLASGIVDYAGSDETETLLVFQIVSGDVVDTDTIELRATVTGETNAYTTTPTITVNEAPPPVAAGIGFTVPRFQDINRNHPHYQDLIFWLNANVNPSGEQLLDISKIQVPAPTINGSLTFAYSGLLGRGAEFSGNDYFTFAHHDAYDLSDQLTIACWIRWDDITDGGLFVGKQQTTTWTLGSAYDYALRHTTGSGDITLEIDGVSSESTGVSADGEFAHLVGVWHKNRDSGNLRLYINGKEETTYKSQNAKTTDISNFTRGFNVGSFSTGTNDTLTQTMFDVRVYSRALSDDEIWQLYAPKTRWDIFSDPVDISVLDEVGALNVNLTFIASSSTLYSPSSELTATPGFIASSSVLYAPTIGVEILPGFISSTSVLYAPTISQTINLTFISSASVIYAQIATVEPQVNLTFITSTSILYNPSLESTITPGFVVSTTVTYAQTASVVLSVSLGFISSASVLYAPVISQTLSLGFISSSSIIYSPVIGVEVLPGFISSSSVIYAPIISQTLTLGFISSASILYAPTIEQTINTLGFIASSTIVYSLTAVVGGGAQNVNLTFIASSSVLYSSSFESTITPGFITSSSSLYAPTIGVEVLPGFIVSGSVVYSPTISQTINLSFISSSSILYTPALELTAIPGFISSTSVVYALTADTSLSVSLGFISSTSVLYSPTVSQTLALGFISSTSTLYTLAMESTIALGFISTSSIVYALTAISSGFLDVFLISIPSATIVYTVAIHFQPPYEIIITQYHQREIVIDQYHQREIVIEQRHEYEVIIDRDFT